MMRFVSLICFYFTTLLLFPAASLTGAQEAGKEIKIETIADGLFNPAGVAIQPGTNHVFVADSGNLRVIRIVEGKIEEVVTGFEKGAFGEGEEFVIGPLGLAFLDQQTLVVGGGGSAAGDDLLMIFKVPDAGAEPVNAEKDRVYAESLPGDGEVPGEGDFFGILATTDAVFVTCNGDDSKGWIGKAKRNSSELSDFARHFATTDLAGVGTPMGIAATPGGSLAVSQAGTKDVEGDSLLCFYTKDGVLQRKYKTGLNDIVSLAYSPARQRLFALDISWSQPEQAGLFKLVRIRQNNEECEARRLEGVTLIRPTAMVFDAEGNLYITQCGEVGEDADSAGTEPKKSGSLIKISGADQPPPPEKPDDAQ